jgi:flagellar hook-associated protein 1 FlgK
MTLSSALSVAQSSLMASAAQADIASRNIANAGRADYARRSALLSSNAEGGVQTLTPGRAADRALFAARLVAGAGDAQAQAVRAGLDKLARVNGVTPPTIADRLSQLGAALDTAASDPADPVLRGAALDAARGLAGGLRAASMATQAVRAEADADIASAVAQVNDLLGRFKTANDEVVRGVARGGDVSDALDRRDGALTELSSKLGVHTLTRANGDMAIFTEAGATLFDRSAREVRFSPTATFDATTRGAAVVIDGAPLGGAGTSGEIAGLLKLRDDLAPAQQAQLDETARGLMQAFVERDPAGALADAAGLFTAQGVSAPPAPGAAAGLAGVIVVAASVDPEQGGDASLLRDGGVAGAAYAVNADGAAGFADRLHALSAALSAPRDFIDATQATRVSVTDHAAASASWLAAARSSADETATWQGALVASVATSLSNATGVNLDDEMAKVLAIENSYRATTRLISTVDEMFQSLLQAVG